jgi:hypothetical protein
VLFGTDRPGVGTRSQRDGRQEPDEQGAGRRSLHRFGSGQQGALIATVAVSGGPPGPSTVSTTLYEPSAKVCDGFGADESAVWSSKLQLYDVVPVELDPVKSTVLDPDAQLTPMIACGGGIGVGFGVGFAVTVGVGLGVGFSVAVGVSVGVGVGRGVGLEVGLGVACVVSTAPVGVARGAAVGLGVAGGSAVGAGDETSASDAASAGDALRVA